MASAPSSAAAAGSGAKLVRHCTAIATVTSLCARISTWITDACLRGADAKDERPVRQALLLPVRCVCLQLILEVKEYWQVEMVDASPAHGAMVVLQGDKQHHNP